MPSPTKLWNFHSGFSLAEVLITMVILGEIATFTIPKVISGQQMSRSNALLKETTAMVAGAFQSYTLNSSLSASTKGSDLTQYMNYLSVDTGGVTLIDDSPGFGGRTCDSSNPCLKLASGAILQYEASNSFGSTDSVHVLFFFFDPDGTYGGSTSGVSKSARLTLFYNGRISSMGQSGASLFNSSYGLGASSGWDPSWLIW